MTTFQALTDAILRALTNLLPLSTMTRTAVTQTLLQWSLPDSNLELLVLLPGVVAFLVFFRFDWLGILSALIRSIASPGTLKPESRNLDQHTVIFFLIILIPRFLLRHFAGANFKEIEFLSHPLAPALGALLTGLLLRASWRWNKRIHGLNHLRLEHAFLISGIGLFSTLEPFSLIALLWIGFAFCNYHYEAVFKYSMLLLGIDLTSRLIPLLGTVGIRDSIEQIGRLNSLAIAVAAFSLFWIGLENLQKTLSENTYRNFQWINLASAVGFFALILAI